MSREVVKYGNKFNKIRFSQFNTTQANIFFAIISRLRDKGTNAVTLDYKHLAKLSGVHYGRKVGVFDRELRQTYHKILHLSIYQNTKNKYTEINLFSKFTIDRNRKQCTIIINPYFKDLLNHLAKQFTRFSLRQYTVLRSKYAKTLFRLIKMFRISGNVYLPIKKFKRLLDVPKSYHGHMITQKIVTPAKIQLTPLVRGLHIITQRHGHGTTITGYHIQFKPDNPKYDKLVGFHKTNIGTHKWMLDNIKLNPYLTRKQKEKAVNNINGTKHYKRHQHEPMKAFNRMLKNCSAHELAWYYDHRKTPLVHFSEYQVRKLKKTIVTKSDEEQLSKIKDKGTRERFKKILKDD